MTERRALARLPILSGSAIRRVSFAFAGLTAGAIRWYTKYVFAPHLFCIRVPSGRYSPFRRVFQEVGCQQSDKDKFKLKKDLL